MKRSLERILTTHAGSLPRPDDLTRMMWDLLEEKKVDKEKLDKRVREAVAEVVKKQRKTGIDVVSDGEMSKVGFSNYIMQRYSGCGEQAQISAADIGDYPALVAKLFAEDEGGQHIITRFIDGPIELKDSEAVKKDIDNLKAALDGRDPDNAFIPAVSPGQMLFNFPNRYYGSDEEYLEAAANALRYEYQSIVDAGFNLQLDAPDMPMRAHAYYGEGGLTDINTYIPKSVEAMNYATRDLPEDKIRLHLCWGNYAGPHHLDVELKNIIDLVLKISAGFISVEGANPRHAHEWEIWKDIKLPEDKVLMPGVIDSVTNHVEHPRLVAQRLEQYAEVLGKERIIAGTDCGFGTFVGYSGTDPDIAWLKLSALVNGAQLASDSLWKS